MPGPGAPAGVVARPRSWSGLNLITVFVVVTSVAKIVACLVLVAAYRAWLQSSAIPDIVLVAHVAVFAGAAVFLAVAGSRDLRAITGQALDGGADLWSFGVVLFECLTGERPFTGPAVEIDAGHEIRARLPECPAPLGDLVADLLAPDKRKRPKSARAVSVRLRECSTLRVA